MRRVGLITSAIVTGLTVALTVPGSRAQSEPAPVPRATTHVDAARTRAARTIVRRTHKTRAVARRRGPTTISIPRIGVTAVVGPSLARGPIFWKKVGRPGEGTTIAIAAHDVTPVPGFHGHGPFHDIDALRKHDRIDVAVAGRRYRYAVTGQRLIPSANVHIADLTKFERLLLTTCWPRGSSEYRLVVYARPYERRANE